MLACRTCCLSLGRGVAAELDFYNQDAPLVSGWAEGGIQNKEYVWDGGRLVPMWQELWGHTVREVDESWGVPNV
jgi:hypothetical protein